MILPFVLGPFEETLPTPDDLRLVESSIEIGASADAGWALVVRVPRIRPEELESQLAHWMGFPGPVEATLSREGVGGICRATFEGG